jgi:septum formation protein
MPVRTDEEVFADLPASERTVRLAKEKVAALLDGYPGAEIPWVIGADTMLEFQGRMIGKPASRQEAEEFLRLLSGSTHLAITGVVLRNGETASLDAGYSVTEVTMASLSEQEIQWYLGTEEWDGVAGGYRIQEKGACLVERISGCYSTVVGLPLRLIYGMLMNNGYPF